MSATHEKRLKRSRSDFESKQSTAEAGLLLFCTRAPALMVRHGDLVQLGDRSWHARVVDGDSLELSIVRRSDDSKERAISRRNQVRNEIQKRKEDVAALGRQRAELHERADEDEEVVEGLMQDLEEIQTARSRYIAVIKELEATAVLQITVLSNAISLSQISFVFT